MTTLTTVAVPSDTTDTITDQQKNPVAGPDTNLKTLSVLSDQPTTDFVLSVIIPIYNEAKTIEEIVKRVRATPYKKELILVDDGSTDGTRDILENKIKPAYNDVKVVMHEHNRGKGAAVRTAISQVTGDYALIQDADLEYDPRDYPALLAPILEGKADVVFGSRFVGGGAHRVHLFWHMIANKMLTMLSNMMTNLNLTDMEVCYKVFRSELLKGILIKSDRFDFEPEITAKVAKKHCRVYEVPISYDGRDYDEGKKIGWRDGVKALWTIIKYRITD
ncbi:MAG: glycosyltransferase family 2 protein [bacterium]|nr:glycosyltransferase family 2 protein [bacterium]